MVAGYGRWVSPEELRELCGVSRDGTQSSSILRAARSFGLIAKGFSKTTADLANLPLPMILF
jgi:ABC-type bacteriocin/lantibiotic exporter with double-glycine peptidase domain